ncbi:MAG TPA: MFS transporter [Chloroflexia bacterium]|nr:MFS transporter [Chloroflexia bacterium]
MRWPTTGLWHNSDFIKLWIGQAVSQVGDRITRGGLPLAAVLTLHATAGDMSLLIVVLAAPMLLVGLLAGVWVDRLRRRPLMIFTDLARAAVLATIPLAAAFGVLGLPQIYVVAALTGVLSVLFNVADQSYLPSLLPPEQLLEGNSKLTATSSIAEIVGPALAGGLVQLITAPLAIAVDAVTFLWSAAFVSRIRKPEPPPPPPADRTPIWSDIQAGLRLVLGHPLLRPLALSAAMRSFFGTFYWVLYDLYVLRELQLTPVVLGLLIAAGGVGALPGALIAGRVVRRFGLARTLLGTRLIATMVGFFTPLAPVGLLAVGFLMISQLVGDGVSTVYEINEVTLRQTLIPGPLQGRAHASTGFLIGALQPFAAVAAGLIADHYDARTALLVATLGGAVAWVYLALSPVRRVPDTPSEGTGWSAGVATADSLAGPVPSDT